MKFFQHHCAVGAFQCNCHLLVCPDTGKAALIDPGDESDKIELMIKQAELKNGLKIEVQYLLHTHGHLDHIAATKKMKSRFPNAKILLHAADDPLYKMLKQQGALFGQNYDDPAPVDQFIEHEEEITFGSLKLKVIHNPGHSPGSISFKIEDVLYSGDTLFKESVGRTDLWGADGDLMFKMIKDRLLTLEEGTIVKPGHGAFSTIHHEKKLNPFLH